MASATVQDLGENRVRLTVEVPPEQVEHAVEHAMSDLAESVKIPGFRKGKIPTPVLVSRLGKERIYAEAVDSHIGGWFWSAAARSGVRSLGRRVPRAGGRGRGTSGARRRRPALLPRRSP